MTVSVDDTNYVIPTNGDAEDNAQWTGSDSPANVTGLFREGTQSLGYGTSAGTDDTYLTISSTSFSTKTLFGWINNGAPSAESSTGNGLMLGDSSNERIYAVGGSDNYGHFVKGWSCFRLDGASLPATHRNSLGSAAPSLGAITKIGFGWEYSITALGKVDTVFNDQIAYVTNGLPALKIQGGTSGAKGTFAEIVTEDEKTTEAWGIIRNPIAGSKVYELQFAIEFGDSSASNSYFEDSGFQLVLVGTGLSAGNIDIDTVAGSGTNHFALTDGVIVNIGTVSNWNHSAAFNYYKLTRCAFTDLGTLSFPAAATDREVVDCIFNNCGQVSIGTDLVFTGNTFNGTTDANGALLLDDDLGEDGVSDCSFVSDGTGHAIEISDAGTYSFTDMNFSGYATVNGTTGNEVIKNTSGGAVIINVSGGSGVVSYETSGGSVTINNNVAVTFTGMKDNSEVRIYDAGTGVEIDGIEDATAGTTDDRTFTWSDAAANVVNYVIHNWEAGVPVYQTIRVNNFTVPSSATSIPIQQVLERNAV